MLSVNAFMPPAVNVFMQAVSTRSCLGKRCIVSALTRCVANINQDNRGYHQLDRSRSPKMHCIALVKAYLGMCNVT